MALVNEQMTVVSEAQARVKHFRACLGSVERKLDDRRREFRAHREKPLAAAVRRRALFSKRGARELVDVARAAVASDDVDIAQPYDAYYDGVIKKDIRALEFSVAQCDYRWKEAQRDERQELELLTGLRRRAKVLNSGCKVATRIVAVTEERRDRRPPPNLSGGRRA